MRKLKVGIIGTGMAFAKLHYPAYQKLPDHYEIKALCDYNLPRAEDWGKMLGLEDHVYQDFKEMILKEDLDVVDIMVPIQLNFQVTQAVAELLAGQKKGIICEKPLAPDLEQGEQARQLPQRYGVPILIAENYRYNEEINLIHDLVNNGRIGSIYYFMQNRVVDFPRDMLKDEFPSREWRQYPVYPSGALTDTGLHDLAGLRYIFGPIEKLHAFGRPQEAEFNPYSAVNVNLLFKSGITGQFSFFCAGKEMQRPLIGLRIFGTEGMIYLEERDCGTINIALNDGQKEQITYKPQAGYYNELLNFHQFLTGLEPLKVPPELEFGDLLTVDSILRSLTDENIVSVDPRTTPIPAYV